jgi:hypothetical protein
MSGTGTTAPVTVSPNADFGPVACGSTGTALPVTVSNGYSFAVHYTAALGQGSASPFTLDATGMGSVAANGRATIQVTPKAVPVPSTPGAIQDTLTVTTDAPGDSPVTVTLTETASGAILTVDMPNTAFGTVAANSPGSLPFTVTNSGNVDAPLTLSPDGSGFGATFTGTATAAAGSGKAAGNATFNPTAVGPANGSLTVTTSAVLCAAPPPAISLTATGTAPRASSPSTSVSFTGDYQISCGSTNPTPIQTVTIANNGDAPLTLASAVAQIGYFNVVQYTTTSIAPGATGTIQLQVPAPIADSNGVYNVFGGTFTDALLYKTNEIGAPTHSIPVTVEIRGANLSWVDGSGNPLPQPLALTQCNSSGSTRYGILNTGNTTVSVRGPQDDRYPYEQNVIFGGTFQSAQNVPGNSVPVMDTVGHIAQNCEVRDMFTYVVAGPVSEFVTPAVVCVPLPTTLVIDSLIPMTMSGCPYCC